MPYYNYLHFVSIKDLRSRPGLLAQIAVAGLNQSELAVLKKHHIISSQAVAINDLDSKSY